MAAKSIRSHPFLTLSAFIGDSEAGIRIRNSDCLPLRPLRLSFSFSVRCLGFLDGLGVLAAHSVLIPAARRGRGIRGCDGTIERRKPEISPRKARRSILTSSVHRVGLAGPVSSGQATSRRRSTWVPTAFPAAGFF